MKTRPVLSVSKTRVQATDEALVIGGREEKLM
jgi:hypothetical protein